MVNKLNLNRQHKQQMIVQMSTSKQIIALMRGKYKKYYTVLKDLQYDSPEIQILAFDDLACKQEKHTKSVSPITYSKTFNLPK